MNVNKPEIKLGLNQYSYLWPDLGLTVNVERLEDDGMGEVSIYHGENSARKLLHLSRLNLLSTQSCTQLSKRMSQNLDIDWSTIFTYVSALTLQEYRKGEPAVQIGKKPPFLKVEYQLSPILEKNQPTTIYAPGGSAKSYLADYIATLVQLNIAGITTNDYCFMPEAANVLYLDWEASKTDHERRVWLIKKGLGVDTEETFLYRFCSQPLINDIYSIQKLVSENQIGLVIIDSQMAAAGYGPDPAQVASQFYNALRSFKCTTLTVDHVSKEDWKTGSETAGPYGSVVKYNRSRSQFEIKKSQNAGEDFIELSLIHKKNNEGKLLKPIGIRINFNEDEHGNLDNVTFKPCDVADNPVLSKTLSIKDQLINELKNGPCEQKYLAENLGKSEDVIRAELNKPKNKALFQRLQDGRWCLLENRTF